MRRVLPHVFVAAVAAVACQTTVHEDLPTQTPTGGRDAASLIPEAPAPTPPPAPALDDETFPDNPGGGGGGAVGDAVGSCGSPTPPTVSRFRINVLQWQPEGAILDATPLVGPDAAYCKLVGFTDGRSFCAVRTEGDPDRLACEALVVGRAADTGRIGPSWWANGRPCRGRAEGASCQNHPDNQFLVVAFGEGTFRACAAGGVCSERTLP